MLPVYSTNRRLAHHIRFKTLSTPVLHRGNSGSMLDTPWSVTPLSQAFGTARPSAARVGCWDWNVTGRQQHLAPRSVVAWWHGHYGQAGRGSKMTRRRRKCRAAASSGRQIGGAGGTDRAARPQAATRFVWLAAGKPLRRRCDYHDDNHYRTPGLEHSIPESRDWQTWLI